MRIDNRKSYFWHWFVMTSIHNGHGKYSIYDCPKISKHDNPFQPIAHPQSGIYNRWQMAKFFRERIRRDKPCKVYRYQ